MKKLLSFALALCLSLGLAAPALAAGGEPAFLDVPREHWAYDYVEGAVKQGWIKGMGEGRFAPSGEVTYAQLCVMLTQAFFSDEVAAPGPDEPWYAPYCAAASRSGVLYGTKLSANPVDETLVGQYVNRYEMALMVDNTMGAAGGIELPGSEALEEARRATADWSAIPEEYQAAVASARAAGILAGMDDAGTFQGEGNMNRAQAAVVLMKLSERKREPEKTDHNSNFTLANGAEITEDNVRAIICGLKEKYFEGRHWTNDDSYIAYSIYQGGYGCEAFALICSDTVFGSLPISANHKDFAAIRAGDMVRTDNDTHTVVVLEKKGDSIVVAEGNYNESIHWGREISRQELERGNFYVRTRYPS